MEPRDPLDDLITETLKDRLGPPPSSDVWRRIAREIAPKRPTLWSRLRFWGRTPLAQSAFVVVAVFALLAQPAIYWRYLDVPTTPRMMDTSVYRRPLPEGDLSGQQAVAFGVEAQRLSPRPITAQ